MRKILWLVMSDVLAMTTAMFFHEPSSFKLVINAEEADKNTYFGYSLSYQKSQNNLVVGAPHEQTGKVFTCPLNLDTTKENIISKCKRYDDTTPYIDSLMDTKRVYKNYTFMLGTSVAALDNSFVTCAPRWTSNIIKREGGKGFNIWGACFQIENNGPITIFQGLYNKLRKDKDLRGNFGWRMLVDDINGIILISKPSSLPLLGDILYIKQENPLVSMESLLVSGDIKENKTNIYRAKLSRYSNLGTAMASGIFFDDKNSRNNQIYAIGLVHLSRVGQVVFLRLNSTGSLELIMDSQIETIKLVQVDDYNENMKIALGSLFGTSLCGARLNEDEYTDLIVGAPAQIGGDEKEMGAVYIYTGSPLMEDFIQKKLKIMGREEGSRFGSTIAAHNLDGDNLQEIFISALYEDEGVLYIISGYEMNEKLKNSTTRPIINILDFASLQRITRKGFNMLGFSITPVSDLDENGCDEIAVGSPGSDSVIILRCIPTVTVHVTAELLGFEKIPETVNDFQIKVCIHLQYNSTMKNIAAKVELNNTIEAERISTGVAINDTADRTFDFNLHTKNPEYCRNINISIVDIRADNKNYTNYKFTTVAGLITDADNATTFNRAWVKTSPYSTLTDVLKIKRECTDKDCDYDLNIDMVWSGGELAENTASKYFVNGRDETLTIQISNEGRPIFDAYVIIKVLGVVISKACSGLESKEGFKCSLPQPFKKNNKRNYPIQLKTSQLNNELTSLKVSAVLYDDNRTKLTEKNITIEYEFDTTGISVIGSKYTPSITEKSMKSESETVDVMQTYTIKNKGSILWKHVIFSLNVSNDEENFIEDLKVTSHTCTPGKPLYKSCSIDLKPNSINKIMVTVVLRKKDIEKSLMDKKLKVNTELLMNLISTSVQLSAKAEATPEFQKDTDPIGNNVTLIILIAVFVAFIIIAVCIIILYKLGFFKRKVKEEMQAEIRRSVRRSNLTSVRNDSLVEIIEEEEIEDNVFSCDDIPAHVHSECLSRRVSRRSYDNKEKCKQRGTDVENEKNQ